MATVHFDGFCVLCNHTVRFLQRHARPGELEYVANPAADQVSVIVEDNGVVYTKSDAVLQLLRHLRQPWPALRALRLVPRPLRDAVYDWVAANRYEWFGRLDVCGSGVQIERDPSGQLAQ
ncbi:MAG: DCC1-like thiol-disulfide oxidoreductase family protein [Candidatus Nanopelagicales bacterium]|jgi:predicted DCC family thiol-disulfide oxidoreductase YuxK|nr:DCC1-like thiol-disulfide oxidoreductase family protein [Candidatus Nanopelagicales bacterium]MCU0295338.1 DCC1-like thiol-disulfide oxidoreductase family protein [Candidatus Nanopelagicales bacterium]MCU0298259.1 DCC1-like thiol-disulfide oxidoreductase family protein [Candidatus Nanopelagicales bacterium]